MISIDQATYKRIIEHAQKDNPIEACGYLAGSNGIITRSYPLTNIDNSPEHFSFDPKEQFGVVKDARKRKLEIIANYHSHPETPARPSEEDIKLAYDPNILYFIVSLAESEPYAKAFKIVNREVSPVEITIL